MNENLKIQALKESISNLVANYEEKVADLRVEITVLSQRLQQLEQELQSRAEDVKDDDVEVVQGEALD